MDKDDYVNVFLFVVTVLLLISWMAMGPLSVRGFIVTMYMCYILCAITMVGCTYLLLRDSLKNMLHKS